MAARADQSMPLILPDERLGFGQFPDLMPQRIRVAAGEFPAAPAAGGRHAGDQFVDLFSRQKLTRVLPVTGLSAAFPPALAWLLHRIGSGVRMLARWRQRRVPRRLAELLFKFGDATLRRRNLIPVLEEQRIEERPYRGRHLSGQLRRNVGTPSHHDRSLHHHASVNGPQTL